MGKRVSIDEFISENPDFEFTDDLLDKMFVSFRKQAKDSVTGVLKELKGIKNEYSVNNKDIIDSYKSGNITVGEALDALLNGRRLSISKAMKLFSFIGVNSED